MQVQFTVQVPKSSDLEAQLAKLQEKVGRLLAMFQPDLVQLHGRLTRHTSREGALCSLNLRLPTGQLASEGGGATAQIALRQAQDELLEQIKKHKQRLHREQLRAGHRTVRTMPPADALRPAPASAASPGAEQADRADLSRYIAANVEQLRRFVARQIHLRERLGQLRPGQLDAREVLDEMIADALAAPNGNHPAPPRWFYLLAVSAIGRLAALTDQHYLGQTSDSLDREITPAETRREEEFEFLDPVEETELRDIMPDPDMANPEQIAYSNEVVDLLQSALNHLDRRQREDLVLFAIEGFTIEELAMISGRKAEQARADLRRAGEALARQPGVAGDLRERLARLTASRIANVA